MKKIIITILIVFFVFLSACNESEKVPSTPPITDSNVSGETINTTTYLSSNVNGLRVRSTPESNGTILGTLDKGDIVTYVRKVGNYYETIYREKTAYIHASYCNTIKIKTENANVERAINLGCTLLGHPYVWGSQRYHWGNGVLNRDFEAGKFDCSALVQYVYYLSNDVILDLTTRTQVKNGKEVKKSDLRRGDLMFFTNASRKNLSGTERIGHVGIYFGDGYILHTASDHAVIEEISNVRWSYYITARRVV